jgi:hypothetical protein
MAKRRDERTIITHETFLAERNKRRQDRSQPSSGRTRALGNARIKRARLVGQSLHLQDSLLDRLEVFARLEVLLGAAFKQARELSPEQYGRLLGVLTLPLECVIAPNNDQLKLMARFVLAGPPCTFEDELGC